jgi:hypothetical protein
MHTSQVYWGTVMVLMLIGSPLRRQDRSVLFPSVPSSAREPDAARVARVPAWATGYVDYVFHSYLRCTSASVSRLRFAGSPALALAW